MQKIATRVFITSSIVFGVSGTIMVLLNSGPDKPGNGLGPIVTKLFMISIFVILTSFAISVACKYLKDKS